jgi:hypothetical protein
VSRISSIRRNGKQPQKRNDGWIRSRAVDEPRPKSGQFFFLGFGVTFYVFTLLFLLPLLFPLILWIFPHPSCFFSPLILWKEKCRLLLRMRHFPLFLRLRLLLLCLLFQILLRLNPLYQHRRPVLVTIE